MTLQGWSLPQSPAGTAALVPPPPWHFSGEALGIDFITELDAVAALLPPGIEPSGDGSGSFVFCDWSSSAERDPRVAADPARGQYREAYVTVYGRLDGRNIARVPYIWVDNDQSFARGLIQGFPKKAGSIAISRAVRVGRGGPRLERGAVFAGHVSSLGRRLASGSVTLNEPADGYLPRALRLPVWHTRLVPDLAGGEPLVHDLARNLVTDFALADVWRGQAELAFQDSPFEELAALLPHKITGGFRCGVAFTIVGAETRPLVAGHPGR
jgi:acetoacetate decarboxylase